MVYVLRDAEGKITGAWTVRQHDGQEELADDHPEAVAFRDRVPLPKGFLDPQTEKERRKGREIAHRLGLEQTKMREQIASVTIAWGALESEMAVLLNVLIHANSGDMGFHIYFAPSNTETRFALVSAAIDSRTIRELGAEKLAGHWSPISNKLARLRGKRNKVIHGSIATIAGPKRHEVRLTAQMFDPMFQRTVKAGQMPGMSADDVERFAQSIWRTVGRVVKFIELVQAAWRGVSIPSPEKAPEPEIHRPA